MTKGLKFLMVLIVATIGFGCASVTKDIKVTAETKPSIKISHFKSYSWLATATILRDPGGQWKPTGLDIDKELKRIIDDKFKTLDLRRTTVNPDLFVGYALGIDMDALNVKQNPDTDELLLKNIPQGALAVVLVDASTGFVIWTSVATADIQKEPTDNIVRIRLEYAIDKMFASIAGNSSPDDY